MCGSLRGGSRSLLVLASGLNAWVVKFERNPQHAHLVLTEYIASRIAQSLGLSVPNCCFIEMPEDVLAEAESRLSIDRRFHSPGVHFASHFVLQNGQKQRPFDPGVDLHLVTNLAEVPGALVTDVWLGNEDQRQIVFAVDQGGHNFRAWWIDFGHCFGAGGWQKREWNPRARTPSKLIQSVTLTCAVEQWIGRAERFSAQDLEEILRSIPACLTRGKQDELARLAERILQRRNCLRELTVAALKREQQLDDWYPVGSSRAAMSQFRFGTLSSAIAVL